MPKGKVTSGDVAKLARVSQSAVSRAFNEGASVSEAMRTRVHKAARALGYRPNAIARAMISGRSRLIAVLAAYLDNQFYPIVLEQLSRALQDKGFHVLLFMTDTGHQDEVVQQMMEYQVEGIVMASATLSSTLARECAQTGIPVVLLNRYVPSSPASSVTSDNAEGGRLVAKLLVDTGHKRIAFIAGHEDSSTNKDRESGFLEGLQIAGQQLWARAVGNYTFDGAANAARQIFANKERPDSIFVANDHMAFAVMDVIRNELGLRIPEDISIAGFDNVPESSWGAYQLTTVEQPSGPMVEATVAILMDQIVRKAVTSRNVILPARLVVRQTVKLKTAME